jgi:polygalacturonase
MEHWIVKPSIAAFSLCSLCCALGLGASALRAQDRRTVRQPVIPPACAALPARLVAVGDSTLAEADERKLDTDRIQQALDHCPRGRSVRLVPAGADGGARAANAFLSGPLQLRAGVTLVVERGAILFGSRDPRVYDLSAENAQARAKASDDSAVRPGAAADPLSDTAARKRLARENAAPPLPGPQAPAIGRCGTVDRIGHGCRPLIAATDMSGAGVMGDGVIDGRGWATLLGTDTTWWQLAEIARAGGSQNVPRIMHLVRANDFTLYRISLRNSANFHVMYSDGDGFTVWGVKVWSPEDARNTDGIDPQNSTNVTITQSWIHTGDDQVAIKASARPSTHMTMTHNHFYTGHGMSIGSETNGGVSAIRVTDLTIEGADNGLRIKSNESRGGPVDDVVYEDVCIRDTKNPVYMDTHYSFYNQAHGLIPVFRNVTLRNVHIAGKGKITLDGYDAGQRLGLAFDGVTLGDPDRVSIVAQHADIRLGPGPVNFRPAGADVTVTGTPATANPADSCAQRFMPFPR